MGINVYLSERDHKITKIDLTKKGVNQKIKIRGFPLLGQTKNSLIEKSYEKALFIILNGKAPSKKEIIKVKKEIKEAFKLENKFLNKSSNKVFAKDPLLFIQISILSLGYFKNLTDFQIVTQSFVSVANLVNDFFDRRSVKPKDNLDLIENLLYMIGKDYKDKKLVKNFTRMMIAWIEIGAGPPSAVATRVNSSSKTSVITAISAGVGNATGSRHSSARIDAMKLIQRIFYLSNKKGVEINIQNPVSRKKLMLIIKNEIQSRLNKGELIPGFGHWIFKGLDDEGIDPRISVVKEAIKNCYPNSKSYEIVILMREVFRDGLLIRNNKVFRLPPNSDMYWSAFLYEFLNVMGNDEQISNISSIFTILTRIGGLLAQDREQRLDDSSIKSTGNWIKH